MVPEELHRLDPAERHQVYKMLRLKVVIHPNASLEVTGVLRDCFAQENQDEDVVFAQDQVEFTVARAVVALHELVAALQEILKRPFLAPRPRGTPAQAPTPA
jgi:hypothetical protein